MARCCQTPRNSREQASEIGWQLAANDCGPNGNAWTIAFLDSETFQQVRRQLQHWLSGCDGFRRVLTKIPTEIRFLPYPQSSCRGSEPFPRGSSRDSLCRCAHSMRRALHGLAAATGREHWFVPVRQLRSHRFDQVRFFSQSSNSLCNFPLIFCSTT